MSPKDFVEFAETLANASGEVIRRYYRTPFEINDKQDASPVTIADREAEKAIRTLIQARFPDHGIIGEEFGNINVDAEYQWVVDPIDGTKSFMIGRPIFGTLIALTHKGDPIISIIDQPITKERWVGVKGVGATLNGQPIKTRKCKGLEHAVLCTTAPELFSDEEKKLFQLLARKVKYVIYGGDCYSYALVAMGLVDIVVESGLKPYDFCGLVNIVNEANGSFTDWKGNRITLNSDGRVLALGDATMRASIVELLA